MCKLYTFGYAIIGKKTNIGNLLTKIHSRYLETAIKRAKWGVFSGCYKASFSVPDSKAIIQTLKRPGMLH